MQRGKQMNSSPNNISTLSVGRPCRLRPLFLSKTLFRALICVFTLIIVPFNNALADKPETSEDGTVHVPAFDFPLSELLNSEARSVISQTREFWKETATKKTNSCPRSSENSTAEHMSAVRKCMAEIYFSSPPYISLNNRYKVTMKTKTIAGVYAEIFTPDEGVAEKNKHRVLINLHGGGFWGGSRSISHMESISIASVGKIKVISVDYRASPERQFPAASEDVTAVYKKLLEQYEAANIGIYGSSAGGVLTAQSVAWFQNQGLPAPGAIGIFVAGTQKLIASDSMTLHKALSGNDLLDHDPYLGYMSADDYNNPLAYPARSSSYLARFPASLLISGTRDFNMSSTIVTHSKLVKLGVEADLHIWEGMGHDFLHNADFPAAREAFDVIANFFDKYLGYEKLKPQ